MTISRRQIVQSLLGGSLLMPGLLSDLLAANNPQSDNPLAPKAPHFPGKAKRVIFLFSTGGVSQVDTFDPKPKLVTMAERKGLGAINRPLLRPLWDFKPNAKCGTEVSDLFPHLRDVMDEVCLIRSMKCDHNEHFQATLGMHCGSITFKRPSLGSWVSYGLGTETMLSNPNITGCFASLTSYNQTPPPTRSNRTLNYSVIKKAVADFRTAIG